jgi:hypothetical protein
MFGLWPRAGRKDQSLFRYLVVKELAGNFSFREDQDPIGDREHFGQVRRNEENGEALLREAIHDLENFCFGADVDATGRFIQQEDLRLGE